MSDDEPRWLTELIELRLRMGNPSLREIAELSGVSHAHVGDVLKGRYFPKLDTLLAIACAMGGDEDAFNRWWQDAARRPVERVPDGPKIPLTERALLSAILEELRGLREDLGRRRARGQVSGVRHAPPRPPRGRRTPG